MYGRVISYFKLFTATQAKIRATRVRYVRILMRNLFCIFADARSIRYSKANASAYYPLQSQASHPLR